MELSDNEEAAVPVPHGQPKTSKHGNFFEEETTEELLNRLSSKSRYGSKPRQPLVKEKLGTPKTDKKRQQFQSEGGGVFFSIPHPKSQDRVKDFKPTVDHSRLNEARRENREKISRQKREIKHKSNRKIQEQRRDDEDAAKAKQAEIVRRLQFAMEQAAEEEQHRLAQEKEEEVLRWGAELEEEEEERRRLAKAEEEEQRRHAREEEEFSRLEKEQLQRLAEEEEEQQRLAEEQEEQNHLAEDQEEQDRLADEEKQRLAEKETAEFLAQLNATTSEMEQDHREGMSILNGGGDDYPIDPGNSFESLYGTPQQSPAKADRSPKNGNSSEDESSEDESSEDESSEDESSEDDDKSSDDDDDDDDGKGSKDDNDGDGNDID
jgi:hypothetical protein